MKRTLLIIIIVGMLGWAVYDLVLSDSPTDSAKETTEAPTEEKSQDIEEEIEEGESGELETGLERDQLAPDFELDTLEGETVKLSDFYGKPILLNFWASWCAPCRAEIPDMQKFFEDQDVEVVAVNLTTSESSKDDIPEFVDEFGMTFPVLLDEQGVAQTIYEIQPIPTTFLINSEGIIHNIAYGPLNYDLMVQAVEEMEKD